MTKPFRPSPLPVESLDWEALVPIVGTARDALARYDASLQSLVNPEILVAPLRYREAVLSSRIEGTQATLDEVLAHEADPEIEPTPRTRDIREVLNYRAAIEAAVEELDSRPISLNMLKRIHAVLLAEVRGHDRARGEFRRIQNHIGPDIDIAKAVYVPPAPNELMPLLDNLEEYIHSDEKDTVVQVGLVHAQFELIHPFLDGNGRVGRILIPLMLFAKGVMTRPVFYLSPYLEYHCSAYFDRLLAISEDDDHQGWIEFFLNAVTRQARADIERITGMHELYDELKQRITDITRSQFVIQLVDTLFVSPIFSTPQFVKRSGIPYASGSRLLKELESAGILSVFRQGRGRRATIWGFPALLNLVR